MATTDSPLIQILKQFAQNLPQVGQQAGQFLQQQGNPQLFAQQQENARLAQQIQAQFQQRNSLSAYEQAQLAQSASQSAQQTELDKMKALQGGFTRTPAGASSDFTLGSQGFTAPPQAPAEPTHTIAKDSPLGKAIGLDQDLTGIATPDYIRYALPQMEKLSLSQDKATQLDANGRAVDFQMPSNQRIIQQRFSPTFYQQAGYGEADPLAQVLAQNYTQRLQDAAVLDKKKGDMAATSAVMKELGTLETPWEKARQATLNRQVDIAARAQQNATTETDRSYQFTYNELKGQAKPIDDAAATYAKLKDTLNNGSPASDAVLAPQVIKFVAGGAGSGIRITMPEITSLVGGRSNWESLQAAAQKWSLDPSTANSITPVQRQQIRSLVDLIGQKVTEKQKALTSAFSQLANPNATVADHRRILDKTRQAVVDVDSPASSSVVDSLVQKYSGGR